jgi:hypothetical protein
MILECLIDVSQAPTLRTRGLLQTYKIHADIGSQPEMRRSYSWMRRFSGYARLGGFAAPVYYEFSLGDFSR